MISTPHYECLCCGVLNYSIKINHNIYSINMDFLGEAKLIGKDCLVGKAMTVKGPVEASELGVTLMHEHILADFTLPNETLETWSSAGRRRPKTDKEICLYNAPLAMHLLGSVSMGAENRDNWLITDVETVINEVNDYRWCGGGSIVDVTSKGLRPNPQALKRVSEATGVHVVMGTGWYQRAWVGDRIDLSTVEQLIDEIVHDIMFGAEDTGIRAGMIGEINPLEPRSGYDRKILEAVARASRFTGAPISLDISLGQTSPETVLDALDTLEEAGANLSRVAVGHANDIGLNISLIKQILETDVYLQFDRLGDFPHVLTRVSDHDVAIAVIELIKQGYNDRILLSQDVCSKIDLKAYGGSGYSFILEKYTSYLRKLGVTEEQLRIIMIDNPKRLLSFTESRRS